MFGRGYFYIGFKGKGYLGERGGKIAWFSRADYDGFSNKQVAKGYCLAY